MLADPAYCDLVHTIGVASLCADDKQIWHLTKIYWRVNTKRPVWLCIGLLFTHSTSWVLAKRAAVDLSEALVLQVHCRVRRCA